jgi:hypothetical protein
VLLACVLKGTEGEVKTCLVTMYLLSNSDRVSEDLCEPCSAHVRYNRHTAANDKTAFETCELG